ncbi:hypothetical protein OH492_17160 [Vibrio chagasii]|nr:hypothetical protein [Vibrio chagasii]
MTFARGTTFSPFTYLSSTYLMFSTYLKTKRAITRRADSDVDLANHLIQWNQKGFHGLGFVEAGFRSITTVSTSNSLTVLKT